MAEYLKFRDYVIYAEERDGGIGITVQPHDLTKLAQYHYFIPAEGEATATKLTADTDMAQAKAAEMEAVGAVDAKFAEQMRAEAIKAKKAELQMQVDELAAQTAALQARIAELDSGKLGAEAPIIDVGDVKP